VTTWLNIGNLLPILAMAQVVKTIKGRKYAYDVKWDPQQRKQIWRYQGKVEEKIDSEKLKGELYSAIMRCVKMQKNDMKKIMKAIQEVLAKYETCW
jgi:hypothetical protein